MFFKVFVRFTQKRTTIAISHQPLDTTLFQTLQTVIPQYWCQSPSMFFWSWNSQGGSTPRVTLIVGQPGKWSEGRSAENGRSMRSVCSLFMSCGAENWLDIFFTGKESQVHGHAVNLQSFRLPMWLQRERRQSIAISLFFWNAAREIEVCHSPQKVSEFSFCLLQVRGCKKKKHFHTSLANESWMAKNSASMCAQTL